MNLPVLKGVVTLFAIPVVLYGCLEIVHALAALNMLVFGGVAPGTPIFMDELAPTIAESSIELSIGFALVAIPLFLRWLIHRKMVRAK